MKNKNTSVIFLILANLLPLFGVIFFEWNLFSIIFLYWTENIVVGFYNVLKILKSIGSKKNQKLPMSINNKPRIVGKVGYAGFFIFHYGIFTIIHGVFVFLLFGPPEVPLATFSLSIVLLFISHGISYFSNFIGKKNSKNYQLMIFFHNHIKEYLLYI